LDEIIRGGGAQMETLYTALGQLNGNKTKGGMEMVWTSEEDVQLMVLFREVRPEEDKR
jgi:hypothetical protein